MLPQAKSVVSIASAAITAGSTTSSVIDRLGYDYADIDVVLKGVEATTASTLVRLQESDDTENTNFATIDALSSGTGFTLPTSMSSAAANVFKMRVDCRKRKRYLRVQVSPGTHSAHSVHATLLRGKAAPGAASDAGTVVLVEG